MELKVRTCKSKEKHADFLMKVSLAFTNAFYLAILIVPIVAIMKSLFEPSLEPQSIYQMFLNIGWGKSLVFFVCELCALYIATECHDRGLDIYDELYPDDLPIKRYCLKGI